MNHRYEQLAHKLSACGQEHLLQFYDTLSAPDRSRLLEQIERLDLPAIAGLAQQAHAGASDAGTITPIESCEAEALEERERERLTQRGLELLGAGKVAAFVVAGGQGSRLGHEGPKGTYDIGLPSGKTLFQLQAERLLRLSQSVGKTIPWYIMTSGDNHDETVRFFAVNGNFGYEPDQLFFFRQHSMPSLDEAGRIMLSAPGEIGLAASGNGDAFASLKQSGGLADMRRRGIEWVFYYNVDNALIRIAEPLFVGAAAHFGNPIATKVAQKAYPEEKVGILCLRDGRPAVVEYTEVPQSLQYETDDSGRLKYGLGNLSIHLFRLDFIEAHADAGLAYHAAHKKIRTVDERGNAIVPEQPNGYKFERFIFDLFPLAERMTVWSIRREEEFAPVKNKEGTDSPATARRLLLDQHRAWLLRAGADPQLLAERDIEIPPLVSGDGEGLTPETVKSLLE
ncbi:UDPGP type 1 family protein [Paenibacillus hodogayensis]|uniref:UDPGP type 1 family protein n=1 Tax=Paenibacillus hodogayensis TaxID=279208 RepID=A0ABV5VYU6_9BACL